jgi:chromosome segregation ATPase
MRLVRFIIFINVVIFGVSFGLVTWIAGSVKIGFFAGTIAVVTSYAGTAVLNKRRLLEQRSLRNSLYNQIQDLEQEEEQLYHSLYEASITKQEIEGSVQALQAEYERLRLRVVELHNQRSLMHQNLVELKRQHQQHKEPLQKLQKQINFLEQRQTQVKHSLELKTTEVQQAETKLNVLRLEIQELQNNLVARTQKQEEIDGTTFLLKQEKRELEQKIQELQEQLQSVTSIRTFEEAIAAETLPNCCESISFLPKEWRALVPFIQGLSDLEKEAFLAIVEQSEEKLKQIADRQTTMPEVLIESLNETAIDILGDTLFVSGGSSIVPEFHEEYGQLLLEPIQLKFKDILSFPEKQPQGQTSEETL